MTFVLKSEKVNGYTIGLQQEKFSTAYEVEVSKCGRVVDKRYYTTKEKAMRRFRDLRKRVQEWGD